MTGQRDALLRLLRDDDPSTLNIIKAELARRGHAALPEFHALLGEADPAVARHLRDVIARIEEGDADQIFGQLCAAFAPDGDLEEAAWRLAATFLPGEDFAPQREALNEWGNEVSRRCCKAESDTDRIATLIEFLAHDVGLRGNEEDYYNINNSLLPEVIDTRRGIPITLSLVYMLVGQRPGISISGVGLPGHFLVRHGPDFFDPFHGGRRVGLEACRAYLEQQKIALTPAHLQPVQPAQMLARMLNNIRMIAEKSDPPLAAKVSGSMELLSAAK